jgi:hypothetical protein
MNGLSLLAIVFAMVVIYIDLYVIGDDDEEL